MQDQIAGDFCEALGLTDVGHQGEWKLKHGLPGPMHYWGVSGYDLSLRALRFKRRLSQIQF